MPASSRPMGQRNAVEHRRAAEPQLAREPHASNTIPAAVDASDLNNARTLAILSTPPFSCVLDVGCGTGLASRALAERGCRVWAIEKNPEAATEAARWCEQVLTADVESLDLERAFPRDRFDTILLLDVVEHLREPARTLSTISRMLAPGGRVIISVPNVGHAAVRLQLLTGRFVRTDSGLLDRTHLQFFDRAGLYALLASVELRVIDEMRTVRAATETEIPVDLESFPADAVRLATQGADAHTYQYVVLAVPRDGRATGAVQGVAGALKDKIIAIEHEYHALEKWARGLESQLQQRSETATQAAAARAEYEAQTAAARAEYEAQTAAARAEYEAQTAAARVENDAQAAAARVENDAQAAAARAEYEAQAAVARAEYRGAGCGGTSRNRGAGFGGGGCGPSGARPLRGTGR